MSLLDTSTSIDPVTNNIRRIFRERGFRTQKEMAEYLGEKPDVFKHYIWAAKRQIPSYDKLKRWAVTLDIEVAEFFLLTAKEPWPYRPSREKKKRKAGISYRMAKQIEKEVEELLPYETIMVHEGLSYLYNTFGERKDRGMAYKDIPEEGDGVGMAAEEVCS